MSGRIPMESIDGVPYSQRDVHRPGVVVDDDEDARADDTAEPTGVAVVDGDLRDYRRRELEQ